ncbi:MAG TPA: hypothetical protein VGQ82_08565 [Chthoniobacterales bacterium]|nr:hypothetical protein [Chthoniobacterales bacterium]
MNNINSVALILAWIGTGCWGVCFWWMHRLSGRQEAMLQELHDVATRIERLSKAEHDMIREVHPVVGEIKESVQDVAHAVGSESSEKK